MSISGVLLSIRQPIIVHHAREFEQFDLISRGCDEEQFRRNRLGLGASAIGVVAAFFLVKGRCVRQLEPLQVPRTCKTSDVTKAVPYESSHHPLPQRTHRSSG